MGSGRCSPEDWARALFCAEAVRRGQNSEVEEFLRSIQSEFPFGDVRVSLDHIGVKFLVADAGDTDFIAFQETPKPEFRFGREFSKLPSGGSVDNGIFELSNSFLGPGLNILSELFGRKKRVVFCGHGVGGAVAHMVVLRFWDAYYKSGRETRGDENDMISIAFGAPYICSSEYAEEVNRNEELKSHFFSFVHEDDPVSPILKGTVDRDGGYFRVDEAGKGENHEGSSAGFCGGAAHQFWEGTDQVKRALGPSNPKICQQQKFFPIGRNTRLVASQGSGPSYASRFSSKQWSFYESYRSALPRTGITENSPDAGRKLALNVITPAPKIASAKLKAMDSGNYFILIKGSDLLFLQEPVRLNGLYPWNIIVQKDSELCIVSPTSSDKTKGGYTKKALNRVVLKTAFGAADPLVLEENTSNGPPTAVRRLLCKIMQTYVVHAIPPLCIIPSTERLNELDSIAQCVPNLENKKLPSTILRNIANRKDLDKNIEEMNNVGNQVIEFLTRSFNIEYEDKLPVIVAGCLGGLALLTGLVLLPLSGIFYAVGGVAYMFTTGCLATGGGVAAMAVAVYLGDNVLMVPEYLATLEYAIQEARCWAGERDLSHLKRTEADLEALLVKEVEPHRHVLNEMMEKIIQNPKTKGINLLSSFFEGATSDSKAKLLRRMQIVAKTVHIYNTAVKDLVFVGVVGAEDAGKSTFIKKLLGEEPGAKVPNIGNDVHTETVTPYQLNSSEKLWLVDFPGLNGTEAYADAFKQFTSLPSSCILFLDFKHDIKKDQVKMYKKVEKDFGSKITVVFNRVDMGFSLHQTLEVKKLRFSDLRRKAVEKLGCHSKDVHFVCLDPDPVEKLTNLKNGGVLDFEDLAKIVLLK